MDGLVPTPGRAQPDAGPLSGGRQRASGTGSSDGGAFGPVGGGSAARGSRFDEHVPAGGYAWWYVDALSDDGQHGLTIIAFIGSVFSPYYAWARAHGKADPLNHCAVNVALYGNDRKRWAMTERGRGQVGRASSALTIGPSRLTWDGDTLVIRVDEVTAPAPRRIRGAVRVYPKALTSRAFALDPAGRHRWWPIAPSAHVEVTLEQPAVRWSGDGYLDSNTGTAPLEGDFQSWNWSRTSLARTTAVLYDVVPCDGVERSLALRFDPNGQVEEFAPPVPVRLTPTLWRIARATRADDARSTKVVKTLEDAPFYARSLLSTRLLGQSGAAVHESLSLQRFRARWVQALLPFRMPRAWRR